VREDADWREPQVGSPAVMGDNGDDEDGAEGEGDLEEDSFPAEAIVGAEAVVALGCGEEAFDDRAREVTEGQ
jgi:hypothetical protein